MNPTDSNPADTSPAASASDPATSASSPAPGALRLGLSNIVLNGDRGPGERASLVIVNAGDRPIQIGSHLHLPDANRALEFDRAVAWGFRLDIPSGTSQRFEPGVSRRVDIVALRGRRRVAGIQRGKDRLGALDGLIDESRSHG